MQLLDKIQKSSPKILVVGDIMLDRFIFGVVDRISPEAPVPVVRSFEEKNSLGGCGNVLRNLVNLGVNASIISYIGKDQAGDEIIDNLIRKGISSENIQRFESVRTTEKMRIVGEGQQLVRVDWDSNSLSKNYYKNIHEQIPKIIKNVDGVIISDYNKGVCTDDTLQLIKDVSRHSGKLLFIDPKGNNWSKYAGADLITPNKKEAEIILDRILVCDVDFEKAGIEICEKFNIKACLITRGSEGMTYIGDGQKYHIKSEAKEIFDVSGAGDTVIASFASGILAGFDPEVVTRFANKAAGIVVGHIGTTAITVSELKYFDK